MAITVVELPMEAIARFCALLRRYRKGCWQVIEIALFGSALRDDFRADSDIDVMVQFHPDAHPTFSTLNQMEAELNAIFQRKIDLVTREGIQSSRNYWRRQEILASAQVIYAARSSVST